MIAHNDLTIDEDELIVDLFAGGGGASEGIELALGRPVSLAVNHSRTAIECHQRNHPPTSARRAALSRSTREPQRSPVDVAQEKRKTPPA